MGLYKDDIKTLKKKTALDKKWVNFKSHFAVSYHGMKEEQNLTIRQGIFDATNSAVDIAPVLDQLTMTVISDRNIVIQLTTENSDPMEANNC